MVQVANLLAESPETEGLDGTDHLTALLDHGVRVDSFLYEESGCTGGGPLRRLGEGRAAGRGPYGRPPE